MHHPTGRTAHTTAFVTSVVEHWLEHEIVTVEERLNLISLMIPLEHINAFIIDYWNSNIGYFITQPYMNPATFTFP